MSQAPTYSVVIPVFNEEAGLEELYRQLTPVLDELDGPAEVILVDDGSRDRSFAILKSFAERGRNFTNAGIDAADDGKEAS